MIIAYKKETKNKDNYIKNLKDNITILNNEVLESTQK